MNDNEDEHIRYDDKYAGLVADIKDPLLAGRIKVTVPAISEDFTTDWLLPAMDSAGPGSGWYDPPPLNATVWVVFQEGDPEHGRYIGCSWSAPDGVSEVPTEFQRETPTNRGYKSPGGNLLEFDDGNEEDNKVTQGIRLTSILGHFLKFIDDPDTQALILGSLGGHIINMDDKNELFSVTSFGDMILNIAKNLDINITENYTVNTTGNTEFNSADFDVNADNFNVNAAMAVDIMATAMASFKGTAGTEVGSASSTTMVNGVTVLLAGGGAPVAVVGGQTLGIGNLGAPVVGSIVQGSTKVFAPL